MKPETEAAVRSIVSADAEVTKEMLERAVDILRGRCRSDEDLVHTVKFKHARELLGVSSRTLSYYLDNGYLDRVYGCGKRALGVTRESLFRFQQRRLVVKREKQSARKAAEGANAKR